MQAITSFVLVLCMFRFWGDEAYGVYAYYVSIITVGLVAAEYGTPSIFRREFQDTEDRHFVYNHFFILRLIAALCCVGVFYLLYLKHDSLFFIYYIFTALLCTLRLNEYALEVRFQNATVAKVKTSVYFFGMIAKVVIVVNHGSVEQIALVSLCEHVILTGLFLWFAGIRFVITRFDPSFFYSIVRSATMMALSFLVTILGGRIYVFIVYDALGEAAVGQYSLCNRMIEMLMLPTQIGFSVLVPLLVSVRKQGDSAELYRKIMNCAFYVYLIGSISFIIVQKPLMHLLFSDRFTEYTMLTSLLVLLPLVALNNLANVYYISHKHDRVIFFRNLLFLVFSLGTGLLLIPMLGLLGIAASLAVTFLLMEVGMSLANRHARTELMLRLTAMMGIASVRHSLKDLYHQKVNLKPVPETEDTTDNNK